MQFGHNDEKSEDPTRYAAPDQFAANLLAYAHAAQAKGALPRAHHAAGAPPL